MRTALTFPSSAARSTPRLHALLFPVLLVGYDLEETRMLNYRSVLQRRRKRGGVLGVEGA